MPGIEFNSNPTAIFCVVSLVVTVPRLFQGLTSATGERAQGPPDRKTREEMSSVVTNVFFTTLLAVLGCSAALLAALSQEGDGKYAYHTSVIPFTSEIMKLVLSLVFLQIETGFSQEAWDGLTFRMIVQYGGLGLLYAIQNNMLFLLLGHVDPATYQVLSNMRIPFTAFLLYLLTGRSFERREIVSIVILVYGAMLSQVTSDFHIALSFVGALFMALNTTLSGLGGVANQILLKGGTSSIHLQNAVLYFFGVIFSTLNMARDISSSDLTWGTLYTGFNAYAVAAVINLAILGIATSAILKYCDAMIRSIANVLSVMLSTVATSALLGKEISAYFALGALITSIGIYCYQTKETEPLIDKLFATAKSGLSKRYPALALVGLGAVALISFRGVNFDARPQVQQV